MLARPRAQNPYQAIETGTHLRLGICRAGKLKPSTLHAAFALKQQRAVQRGQPGLAVALRGVYNDASTGFLLWCERHDNRRVLSTLRQGRGVRHRAFWAPPLNRALDLLPLADLQRVRANANRGEDATRSS